MTTTPDSLPPHADDVARGTNYVFHEPLETSWRQSLMALPLALLAGGLVLWLGYRPAVRLQARVEVSEVVKAVGTTGQAEPRPSEPVAVGTTGITMAGKPSTMGPTVKRILPGDIIIAMPAGSTEDRLAAFLESAANGSTTIAIDRLTFSSGSAQLTPRSREQVDTIAKVLRAYPQARIIVAGYTDDRGNEAANLSLSHTRARAVNDRLITDGVSSNRVHAQGFGSQKPVADNDTEEGRSQNRRVVLEVNTR
jgi:outer membrane protein OmpA-like peptidoglycan-associated protein